MSYSIISTIDTGHTGFVADCISLNNQEIVTASHDNTIKCWNVDTGKLDSTFTAPNNTKIDGKITGLALLKGSRTFVSIGEGEFNLIHHNVIGQVATEMSKCYVTYSQKKYPEKFYDNISISSVAPSAKENQIALSWSRNYENVGIYDIRKGLPSDLNKAKTWIVKKYLSDKQAKSKTMLRLLESEKHVVSVGNKIDVHMPGLLFSTQRSFLDGTNQAHYDAIEVNGGDLLTSAEDKMLRVWKNNDYEPACRPIQINANVYSMIKPCEGQVICGTDSGLFTLDTNRWDVQQIAQSGTYRKLVMLGTDRFVSLSDDDNGRAKIDVWGATPSAPPAYEIIGKGCFDPVN